MNVPTGTQPLIALHIGQTQDQPEIVVSAEVFTAPKNHQEVKRLKDQVAQLKKSNKTFKSQAKAHEQAIVLADALHQEQIKGIQQKAEHLFDIAGDQIKEHEITMAVEGRITDFACGNFGWGSDTLIRFDQLKHPDEMPKDIPHRLGQCRTLEQLGDESENSYRLFVQKHKGISMWEGVEKGDPRVHEKMIVKPAFRMNIQEWMRLGGANRHWFASWKWCEWTWITEHLPVPTLSCATAVKLMNIIIMGEKAMMGICNKPKHEVGSLEKECLENPKLLQARETIHGHIIKLWEKVLTDDVD